MWFQSKLVTDEFGWWTSEFQLRMHLKHAFYLVWNYHGCWSTDHVVFKKIFGHSFKIHDFFLINMTTLVLFFISHHVSCLGSIAWHCLTYIILCTRPSIAIAHISYGNSVRLFVTTKFHATGWRESPRMRGRRGAPLQKRHYLTAICSSNMKMVADRHRHA